MNKRDKIDYILSLVKQHTEDVLAYEEANGIDLLGAEEIVIAATEQVLNNTVEVPVYTMPVARVDRDNVSFSIGDEFELPLYGDTDGED